MITANDIWRDLTKLRAGRPLVHNITNYVVMNTTANALLALGASPVMAHAEDEAAEMAALASALVLNIGTLSPAWVKAMLKARDAAVARKIPVILDPVGAGATAYRTKTARELIPGISIIRGNASEIMALAGIKASTKGVDSTDSSTAAVEAGRELIRMGADTVSISGETDFIISSGKEIRIRNGSPVMPLVTGMGCTASAITGAFAAVSGPFTAAASAMAVMGITGEIAESKSSGPGSFQTSFIDTLYALKEADISSRLRLEETCARN